MCRLRSTRLLAVWCVCLWGAAMSTAGADAPEPESFRVLPETIDGVASHDMMHAMLMRRAEEALRRRLERYESRTTADQVRQYQERMRQFFVSKLGGFPERTPLEAQVVDKLERDGYRIEKIIFQSQPGFYVSALLYLPESEPPYPGVLVPCGHSANGKAAEAYQLASILLARNGCAALCYDPVDQGERYQLLDDSGTPEIDTCTTGHCLLGVGSTLLGRNTATFRIWDGMRAIDYLQSRSDIDPKRIGCTGNSGGGTLTSYLMALDGRIVAAAPACYLTDFHWLLDERGPQDAEQNIHAQLIAGMDHADYVMMRAPKPTLMCTATHDSFPIEGSWNSFRQAKRVYARLGFSKNVDLIETDARHGFSVQLREGAVRWMRRWLLRIDDAVFEPEGLPVLSDEETHCTAQGQVMLLEGARSAYAINRALGQQLAEARRQRWNQTPRDQMLAEVRQTAGIRTLDEVSVCEAQQIGGSSEGDVRIQKWLLRMEPGVAIPALVFAPPTTDCPTTIYLHEKGKSAAAQPGGPIQQLVAKGHTVWAIDLRGMGEMAQPVARYKSIAQYIGPDWQDLYLAYLLGTSYLAMRTEDTLRCARLLAQRDGKGTTRPVHLIAEGRAVPAALHAAALEPGLFASVTLRRGLVSWSNLLEHPTATNRFANVVHGALRVYDLPDLLATLPAESTRWETPVDAMDQPLETQSSSDR